jgi:transcriptional regulator with XRE-family HTH domain
MGNTGEELKDRLKRLRTDANLKIREVAKAIEISDQHVKDMEAGRRGIGTDVLLGYSRLFNLSMESILLGEGAIAKPIEKEPVSIFVQKLTSVPDEVYDYAQDIGPKHKVWETVKKLLEVEAEKANARKAAQA